MHCCDTTRNSTTLFDGHRWRNQASSTNSLLIIHNFRPITSADVEKLLLSLPNKQCLSDSLPTWLLKANVDILSLFLCQLFNRCLEHGIVSSSFKSGYVTPLLKKADLDAADVKSYRPITNLSVLSKLLERLVAQQLTEYLTENGLLPELQSAYRAHHSTETAMTNVMGDILLALDSGNLAMLSWYTAAEATDVLRFWRHCD